MPPDLSGKSGGPPLTDIQTFHSTELSSSFYRLPIPQNVSKPHGPRLAPVGSWWCTTASGDGFDLTIIHTRPEISRKDRQYIQIYANKRRIEEFSLVQALTFAYDAWMPGGAFPPAFSSSTWILPWWISTFIRPKRSQISRFIGYQASID
jgi:hypothetical protein